MSFWPTHYKNESRQTFFTSWASPRLNIALSNVPNTLTSRWRLKLPKIFNFLANSAVFFFSRKFRTSSWDQCFRNIWHITRWRPKLPKMFNFLAKSAVFSSQKSRTSSWGQYIRNIRESYNSCTSGRSDALENINGNVIWYNIKMVALKTQRKNERSNQYVSNLMMSVCFMSCHGFRNNNAMFKRGEARGMERVAYLHSINVSVEKTIF